MYLLYLGVKTFLNKFQNFKKPQGGQKQSFTKREKYTKTDLNDIEDADFEEIKKN